MNRGESDIPPFFPFLLSTFCFNTHFGESASKQINGLQIGDKIKKWRFVIFNRKIFNNRVSLPRGKVLYTLKFHTINYLVNYDETVYNEPCYSAHILNFIQIID